MVRLNPRFLIRARIHCCCLLSALVFATPVARGDEPADAGSNSVTAEIDRAMAASWQAKSVEPAPLCSDEVFVRRLYLDLAGRIPTVAERQTFLADERPDKRARLTEVLLGSEDYVQHFADTFDTLLMGRAGRRKYEERSRHQWRAWLERVFRDNRPWNEVTAEILLARPQSESDRGVVWFLYERENDHQKIAEAIAPAFFGIRIECAQCHDHMVATEIEQRHYWGLVAFFNRSTNQETPNGPRISESAIGGFSEFADLEGSSSPNLLTFFESPTIEEARPAADIKQEDSDELYIAASVGGEPRIPRFSRREHFVREIVATHPLIARAFVNRTWAMLMGRGIVHPFDRMDSVHPPSHPELLDWLTDDFRESGYEIRRLVRAIVLSRPYQLSSERRPGDEDPSLFTWGIERPLTAEQLARSIQLVVRGTFRNDDPLVADIRGRIPDVMPEQSVTSIGDALFLTNNDALNSFISSATMPGQLISQLQACATDHEKVDLLFVTAFGRAASDEEASELIRFLAVHSEDAPAASERRLRDAIWAVLTSAEFRFNH